MNPAPAETPISRAVRLDRFMLMASRETILDASGNGPTTRALTL